MTTFLIFNENTNNLNIKHIRSEYSVYNIEIVAKMTLDDILNKTKYDNRIPPKNIDEEGDVVGAVVVNTNMHLRSVDYISTKKMEWQAQIILRHQWIDSRLSYDWLKGQLRYLILDDPSRIWIPDTYVYNSKSTQQHTDLKPNTIVNIYPNGNVLFSIRLSATMSCPMDLKYYPFDSQICSIKFASCESDYNCTQIE